MEWIYTMASEVYIRKICKTQRVSTRIPGAFRILTESSCSNTSFTSAAFFPLAAAPPDAGALPFFAGPPAFKVKKGGYKSITRQLQSVISAVRFHIPWKVLVF